jgi:hypothetical protein
MAVAAAALAVASLAAGAAGCTGAGARQPAGVPARPAATVSSPARSAGVASSPARVAGSVSPAPRRHPAAASVTARLVLPARTMAAGSKMAGRVVVENNTGRAIFVAGCKAIFQVLLVGAAYRQPGGWLQCMQSFKVPAGESSWPVRVLAYESCVQGDPDFGLPSCLPAPQIYPPVPPGDYEAIVSQSTRLFADPAPITIRVNAAS